MNWVSGNPLEDGGILNAQETVLPKYEHIMGEVKDRTVKGRQTTWQGLSFGENEGVANLQDAETSKLD